VNDYPIFFIVSSWVKISGLPLQPHAMTHYPAQTETMWQGALYLTKYLLCIKMILSSAIDFYKTTFYALNIFQKLLLILEFQGPTGPKF
jgi:hypothetical protein